MTRVTLSNSDQSLTTVSASLMVQTLRQVVSFVNATINFVPNSYTKISHITTFTAPQMSQNFKGAIWLVDAVAEFLGN